MEIKEGHVKIKKESSTMGVTQGSDGEHYPYGTSLSLDDDLVDDLEASKLAVGDVVKIHGYAFVDSKSEYSTKNESNKSIRLQMTSLKIDRETDDVAVQLYGD